VDDYLRNCHLQHNKMLKKDLESWECSLRRLLEYCKRVCSTYVLSSLPIRSNYLIYIVSFGGWRN